MKSKIVVEAGQKLPIDLIDPGPLSGGGLSTTTASAIPALPLSPWQMAQSAANSSLPCAGVPLRRQPSAVRHDRQIPARKIRLRDRLPEIWSLRQKRKRDERNKPPLMR